jgi:DNA-binding MarR family transcriptional regulator
MDSRESATRFVELFHHVYLRFYARHPPGAYQPSREALAVLEHLARTGPLTVTEAAGHFERSQSAMSELFDRLESRDLVERIPDQRDRRRHLVWMTETGLEAWRRSSAILSVRRLEVAFERLPEPDRDLLLHRMDDLLTSHLQERSSTAPRPAHDPIETEQPTEGGNDV